MPQGRKSSVCRTSCGTESTKCRRIAALAPYVRFSRKKDAVSTKRAPAAALQTGTAPCEKACAGKMENKRKKSLTILSVYD
jgi:hypothetical protein